MAATGKKGMLIYKIYSALSFGLTPLMHLHIRWRRLKGLEHPTRWPERLGRPSLPRPSGPLLWFHAVSLGEGMAAIPVIRRCVEFRPDLSILMTTTTLSAFEIIKNQLPSGVLYQFSPLDTPVAMDAFLDYWKPSVIVILENELWPNLIMSSWTKGISLALLNARVSMKSFRFWSQPVLLPLISLLLSKFSLIIPLSNMQAIRFQILQAPPAIINFSGDLKYAVEYDAFNGETESIEDLRGQLAQRQVWIAASIHKVMLEVHKTLTQTYPDLITIIVPRYPQHGREIAQELQKGGQNVALRSQHQRIMPETQIYVVDTIGELRHLYKLCQVAVIGGSFLPGLAGHNLSEAAAAGCAVVIGHYVGHFSHMVKKMQQINPLSVMQVHPFLMFCGFIFLVGEAMMVYKTVPATHQGRKILHMILHLIGICCGIVGIAAVFRYHDMVNAQDVYSLHSWIGLVTFCLFGLQWIFGAFTFMFAAPTETRATILPWHICGGRALFYMAICAALTGLMEKSTSSQQQNREHLLMNFTGLFILLFGIFVDLSVTLARYV